MLTPKSRLLEPIESYLGFDIEDMTEDEIDDEIEKSSNSYIDLMNNIGSVLVDEREKLGIIEDQVLPIGLAGWSAITLEDVHFLPLTLLHKQVIIPIDPIVDPRLTGSRFKQSAGPFDLKELKYLLLWARQYAPLLRSGAVLPFSPRLSEHPGYKKAPRIRNIDYDKFYNELVMFEADIDKYVIVETNSDIRAHLQIFMSTLRSANQMKAKHAMCDGYSWGFWNASLKTIAQPLSHDSYSVRHSSTISQIQLPSLSDLLVIEIAALHNNSEAFAIWRDRMAIVTRLVLERVERGGDPSKVLSEELLPLREVVEKIDNEISNSGLGKYLRTNSATLFVAITVAVFSDSICKAISEQSNLNRKLVEAGTGFLVPLLLRMLSPYQPVPNTPICNLYHAVF